MQSEELTCSTSSGDTDEPAEKRVVLNADAPAFIPSFIIPPLPSSSSSSSLSHGLHKRNDHQDNNGNNSQYNEEFPVISENTVIDKGNEQIKREQKTVWSKFNLSVDLNTEEEGVEEEGCLEVQENWYVSSLDSAGRTINSGECDINEENAELTSSEPATPQPYSKRQFLSIKKTISESAREKYRNRWLDIAREVTLRNGSNVESRSADTPDVKCNNSWHSILTPDIQVSNKQLQEGFQDHDISPLQEHFKYSGAVLSTSDSKHMVTRWWESVCTGNFTALKDMIEEGFSWTGLTYGQSPII